MCAHACTCTCAYAWCDMKLSRVGQEHLMLCDHMLWCCARYLACTCHHGHRHYVELQLSHAAVLLHNRIQHVQVGHITQASSLWYRCGIAVVLIVLVLDLISVQTITSRKGAQGRTAQCARAYSTLRARVLQRSDRGQWPTMSYHCTNRRSASVCAET